MAVTACGPDESLPRATDAEVKDRVELLVDSAIAETRVTGATTVIPLEKQECTHPDDDTGRWVYERRVPVPANEAEAVAQRVIALWEARSYTVHREPRFAVAEVPGYSSSVGWGIPGQPYVTVAATSGCRVPAE